MQYGVRQGKNKVFHYGDFDTKTEAMQALLEVQLLQKRRGLYLVKLVPYGANAKYVQAIRI